MSTSESESESESQWNGIRTPVRIKGAPVQVHWTFVALLLTQVFLAIVFYGSWSLVYYELIMFGPILFSTSYVHELGRAIATIRLGGTFERIVLWPLGGLTIYGPTDQGAIGDLKVAIAGPLAHLPLAAIYAIVYTVVKKDGMDGLNSLTIHIEEMKKGFMYIFGTVCRVSFGWNVILFVGHILVPIYPLDGVRIWAGILRSMNVSLAKSAKIISVAGMLSSLIVFLYGCFTVFNIEVEGGVTEILLGGFGLTSSKILYDLVKLGRLTEDPVFGRACYVEHGNSVEIPSTDSNSTPAPSAGSTPIDNAEISEII